MRITGLFIILALAAAATGGEEPVQPPGNDSSIEKALKALQSRYFDEREGAIRTLTLLGKENPDAVGKAVLGLLTVPDNRLRILAIRILGQIEYQPALGQMARLIAKVDRTDPLERAALIEAFVKFGRTGEAHLLKTGADRKPLGRMILGRIALKEVLAFIKTFFGEEDSPGWFDGQFDRLKPRGKPAVYGLLLIVETFFTPGQESILGDQAENSDTIRWLAIHGLGEFRDPVAVPLLKELIQNLETSEREIGIGANNTLRQAIRTAAIACWKCGDQEPLIGLIKRIRNEIEEKKSRIPRLSTQDWEGLADLYWDLAISLSTHGLVEEVVEAYKKNIYWRRKWESALYEENPPRSYNVAQYNIACTYAKAGMAKEGLEAYYQAIKMGYTNHEWPIKDGDLKAVQNLPEFDLALAYTYIVKMGDSVTVAVIHQRNRRNALIHIGRAVSRGLTDSSWLEHDRFAPVRREGEFHWHAARFHARAGRAEACARWLRSGLERQDAVNTKRLPKKWVLYIPLEEIAGNPDFAKVRDHAAVRAVLRERGKGGD
ncbi:MAG: HEAT repeat domain-containing protein [Planctomycetota bacterium]